MIVPDTGPTMIDAAISTAVQDLSKMRRVVNYGLLFSTLLLIVSAIDVVMLISVGRSFTGPEDILVLVPPPMLITPLAIYAMYQLGLMGRIGKSLRSLETSSRPVDDNGLHRKSLTDLHYDVVAAIDRALKMWPLMMVFFVLYFIFWAVTLISWLLLEIFPELKLSLFTTMNILIIPLALVYFVMQTRQWLIRRRKLRELENMERSVLEELRI